MSNTKPFIQDYSWGMRRVSVTTEYGKAIENLVVEIVDMDPDVGALFITRDGDEPLHEPVKIRIDALRALIEQIDTPPEASS